MKRPDDQLTVFFRLERPGLDPSTYPWALQREFMDRLIEALAAMPGGPTALDVAADELRPGSCAQGVRMDRRHYNGPVKRLRKGPTRAWTVHQRLDVQPFYDFIDRNGLEVSAGIRSQKRIFTPKSAPRWTVTEFGDAVGVIRTVGGKEPKVRMVFERHGTVACDVDVDVMHQMAAHLYQRVTVYCRKRFDVATGAMIGCHIFGFRELGDRLGYDELQRRLRAVLGDEKLDPEAYLREIRG